LPVIEANVRDKRQPPIAAMQWLSIMCVFRQRAKQIAAQSENTVGPPPIVVRTINSLRAEHRCAVGIDAQPAVEAPNAGKRAHLSTPGATRFWSLIPT
jgi:hypothetical protein